MGTLKQIKSPCQITNLETKRFKYLFQILNVKSRLIKYNVWEILKVQLSGNTVDQTIITRKKLNTTEIRDGTIIPDIFILHER